MIAERPDRQEQEGDVRVGQHAAGRSSREPELDLDDRRVAGRASVTVVPGGELDLAAVERLAAAQPGPGR